MNWRYVRCPVCDGVQEARSLPMCLACFASLPDDLREQARRGRGIQIAIEHARASRETDRTQPELEV